MTGGAFTKQTSGALPYTLLRDLKPNLKPNEVVKDLIPHRAFGECHAGSGGGKTAIIIDLLLHVAAGMEYRNRRTERQPVVYVALEGHGGIDNRVIAAAAEIGITDAPFALVKATDNFRDPEAAERVMRIAADLVGQFGRVTTPITRSSLSIRIKRPWGLEDRTATLPRCPSSSKTSNSIF